MTEEAETAIESIPKVEIKVDSRNKVLSLQDLLEEKPRVSVKEIEGMDRLIRMLKNEKSPFYTTKDDSE
ncbi:MAG: hypothetical protein GOP50_04840 [Candidatus Heimdallarchaeota archaeon]|nr:hypothetical protein [Candidatus Heimdallarchaeota archaeon]